MIRQTSIETYRKIEAEGLLSKKRFEIYKAIFTFGPVTRSEIAELISHKGYAGNVSARLTELRDMSVVEEVGERVCTITNQKVILWDVNKNIPLKLNKSTKIKCQHCKGKGYFEQENIL